MVPMALLMARAAVPSLRAPPLARPAARAGPASRRAVRVRRGARLPAKKKGLLEGLLYDMEAKRKLKKWYGYRDDDDEDGMGYGDYDDGLDDGEEEEDLGPAVAVLDASSPTGEACVLQLLLLRRRVVAVVDDVDAARASFG